MAAIRPEALDAAGPINPATDVLIIDQGAGGVRKTVPNDVVGAARPLASQAEAEAGTDNAATMTPLRTAQAIEAIGPDLFASLAQGALADSAVQPAREITAGTGLTGGGSLASDIAIALDAGSIASLALADSALQPGEGGTLPLGGPTAFALVKDSPADNDVSWQQVGDMRGSVYDPTSLGYPIGAWGRGTFRVSTLADGANYNVSGGFDRVLVERFDVNSALAPTEYVRVASEPTHVFKFADSFGNWFALAPAMEYNGLACGMLFNDDPAMAANNRTQFQRFLNAIRDINPVSTRGTLIRLPAGVAYMTPSSGVVNLYTGMTLQGSGMGQTILRGTANSIGVNFIQMVAQNNIAVRDLSVDSNSSSTTNGGAGVRINGSCSNITIERVETSNTPGYGMYIMSLFKDNLVIRDCYIHHTGKDGIDIKDDLDQHKMITIDSCRFHDIGVGDAGEGSPAIDFRGYLNIINPYIELTNEGSIGIRSRQGDIDTGGTQGTWGGYRSTILGGHIIAPPGSSHDLADMIGRDCVFIGTHFQGGKIGINARGRRMKAIGCTFHNHSVAGFVGNGVSDRRHVVSNCTFTEYPGSGDGAGVLCNDSNVQVVDSTFSGTRIGVRIISGLTNCVVENNQFENIIFAPLVTPGTNIHRVARNVGYKTNNVVTSGAVSATVAGRYSVVIPHGLDVTPPVSRIVASVRGNTTDFDAIVRIISTDATNVTCLVTILNPAPGAANAVVNLSIDVFPGVA